MRDRALMSTLCYHITLMYNFKVNAVSLLVLQVLHRQACSSQILYFSICQSQTFQKTNAETAMLSSIASIIS